MLPRPLLLDAYCCAGGAGYGYFLAGFEVVGVDLEKQPNYPFECYQSDAVDFIRNHGSEFDFIHTSPPCQFGSQMFCPTKPETRQLHFNLIPQTRAALLETKRPFIIENVPGNRDHLIYPFWLHGSQFELPIFRKRYFESNWPFNGTGIQARRNFTPVPINSSSKKGNTYAPASLSRLALGIDWYIKNQSVAKLFHLPTHSTSARNG